jgi:hypothetical protein
VRNKEKNDYLILPFPRLEGQTHPALVELRRQARLLSLMPFGLDRGAGPYAAALLIDRDMHLRPSAYPQIPPAGLWFPTTRSSGEAASREAAPPSVEATQEERVREIARLIARKWQRATEE